MSRRRTRTAIAVVAVCGAFVAGLAPSDARTPAGLAPSDARTPAERRPASAPPPPLSIRPGLFDETTFLQALASVERRPARPAPGARAVVVPHHWLAGPLIVEGLRDLAASRRIERVILIGPNHSGAGGHPAILAGRGWRTPFGRVEADEAAVRRLLAGGAVDRPDVVAYEHSVAGLVPAIAHLIPGATVVPLIVRADVDDRELAAIAAAVTGLLDEDAATAIVASVDFSHHQTEPASRRYDAETLAALADGDTGRILGFGNEHLDSPETIAVTIQATRAVRFEARAATNSTAFGASPYPPEVTSYIVGFWTR